MFQLSQSGANLDNRVPTPASAASADLHSQHVGADLPAQEVKTEAHHDQQEFEATGGKTEPKMEVGWCQGVELQMNWFLLPLNGSVRVRIHFFSLSSHPFFPIDLGKIRKCLTATDDV